MRAEEAKNATQKIRKELIQQEIVEIFTSKIEPSIQYAIEHGEYHTSIDVQKYSKLQCSLIEEYLHKLGYICVFSNNWLIIDWS